MHFLKLSLPSIARPSWGLEHCFREFGYVVALSDSMLRRWRYSWGGRKAKILNCNYVSRDIKQLHVGRMLIYCIVLDLYQTFYYLLKGSSPCCRTIESSYMFYTYAHSYIQCLLIKTVVSAEELSFIHQRMLTRISGINQAELCHAVSRLFCCKAGWLLGGGNQWHLYQR